MLVGYTPEQHILREEAAAANPDFATLEGRALEDVRQTIAYLAIGARPETVLGGLMHSQYALFDSTLIEGNDRQTTEIAAKARKDVGRLNERGDTIQDVLEGLVKLGFAERVYTPNSVDALLLEEGDRHFGSDRPSYRLSTRSLPPKVQGVINRVAATRDELHTQQPRPKRRFFGKNR